MDASVVERPASIDVWRRFSDVPGVAAFFDGAFERVGVVVTDTGEEFTCAHAGETIELEPGIDRASVDFVVEIERFQVDRLASEAATGELGPLARFRILRAIFTPATQATLRNPVMSNTTLRRLSGVEDLIHVRLLSPEPDQEPHAAHTLLHASGQWLVIPGLHGEPRRIFELTPDEALAYHRHTLATIKGTGPLRWLAFRRWYVRWRRDVSRRP